MRNNFMVPQQNMSSNFIGDDELADLLAEADASAGDLNNTNHMHTFNPATMSMPVQRNQYMSNAGGVFSQTPEGAPIQSPFMQPFNYAQWATNPQQQQASIQQRRTSSNLPNSSFDLSSRVRHSLDRTNSISRSPLTPKTPGTGAVQGARPIHGHRKTSSSQWESNTFSSCLLYTSPSPRDGLLSRMPSSA